MLIHGELTEQIIGAAIEVHRELGPGLLESVYRRCLCHELSLRGVNCVQEVRLPLVYKGLQLDCAYRIDIAIEGKVLVEVKAIDSLAPIHEAQLLTYLRLSKYRTGLLINFNVQLLKDGLIRRVI